MPESDVKRASAAIDRAAVAWMELDTMLAQWFPALSRERGKLAELLTHITDASAALGPDAHGVVGQEGRQ